MRKVSLAFQVVALVAVFGVAAIGQQSQQPPYPVPGTEATLADAARTNNFPLFDSLFAKGGPEAAQYAELHEFWKWSMTDHVGGFYGNDLHTKFAREYPEYAEYIADFAIVDANGHAFYPSAETRSFLLKHALRGDAPVVRVAVTAPKTVVKPVQRVKRVERVEQTLLSVPISIPAEAFAPAVPPPPRVAPVVAAQTRVSVSHVEVQPRPVAVPEPESDGRVARGFVLIVVGLLAAGTLTLVFHTPKETT